MAKKKESLQSLEDLQKDQAKRLIVQFKSIYLLNDVTKKYAGEQVLSIKRLFSVLLQSNDEGLKTESEDPEADLKKNYKNLSKEEKDLYRFYAFNCISEDARNELMARLKKDKAVENVDIDPIAQTNAVPNDPEYPRLWGMQKINAPRIWDCTKGCGVIVAIVDTGIDHTHPDLNQNMWELSPGIHGKNFSSSYGFDPNNTMDGHSHGTHVAGTVAAEGNNNYGVIGVAPGAKLMAMKGLSNWGGGYFSWLANCIVTAADWGAKVINNSWGCRRPCPNSNPALAAAIAYARLREATIVFAAGNSNDNVAYYYPQNDSRTITVGATDQSDNRASFSNYGPLVDVAAPGVDILSTVPGNSFQQYNGTSMAAPHVSGMAALILSKLPGLHPTTVENIIESYVATISPDKPIGSGRIDLTSLHELLCKCELSRCDINQAICEYILLQERDKKFKKLNPVHNSEICRVFEKGECLSYEFPNLTPCFSLHSCDGPSDKFETHDNEKIFITVCNPFENISFKGLTITKITITPNQTLPNGDASVEIIPSKLICYKNVGPCSCVTREYSFMSHFALPGNYTLSFDYCIDEISVESMKSGSNAFEIELVAS